MRKWQAVCCPAPHLHSTAGTVFHQARRSRKDSDFAHSSVRRSVSQVKTPGHSCLECGQTTPGSKRFCSPECLRLYNEGVWRPRFTKAGLAALGSLRAENQDPAHGGDAARKRGDSNRRRFEERKAWEDAHSPAEGEKERERFGIEILPALALIPINRISKATGLSIRYASLIRAGEYIPHPVHYPALRKLIPTLPS